MKEKLIDLKNGITAHVQTFAPGVVYLTITTPATSDEEFGFTPAQTVLLCGLDRIKALMAGVDVALREASAEKEAQ